MRHNQPHSTSGIPGRNMYVGDAQFCREMERNDPSCPSNSIELTDFFAGSLRQISLFPFIFLCFVVVLCHTPRHCHPPSTPGTFYEFIASVNFVGTPFAPIEFRGTACGMPFSIANVLCRETFVYFSLSFSPVPLIKLEPCGSIEKNGRNRITEKRTTNGNTIRLRADVRLLRGNFHVSNASRSLNI